MRKGGNRWVELPPAPLVAVFRRDGCHGTTFQPGQQARPAGPRHRDQEPTDTGPRSGSPTEPDPPTEARVGPTEGGPGGGATPRERLSRSISRPGPQGRGIVTRSQPAWDHAGCYWLSEFVGEPPPVPGGPVFVGVFRATDST